MDITNADPVIPNYADWLSPAEVATRVGAGYMTVYTWITVGMKMDVGRLRLKAVKLGGKWRVDPAAIQTFVQRTTAAALGEGEDVLPPPPSAAQARRRVSASMDRLRAMGVAGQAAEPTRKPPPRRRGH